MSETEKQKFIKPSGSDKTVGRIVELMGRLLLDRTLQDIALIGETTLRPMLVPHDTRFYFKSTDTILFPQVKFLEASWFVHKSKLHKDVYEAHAKALTIAPAKYPITRVEVKSHSVSKGSLDCGVENAIHGQLPRRLYICFVSNNPYNGSYQVDPFKFEDLVLNFCLAI